MVKRETIIIQGEEYIKQYSDEHRLIRKVGTDETFESAIDPSFISCRYEETDKFCYGYGETTENAAD